MKHDWDSAYKQVRHELLACSWLQHRPARLHVQALFYDQNAYAEQF